MKYLMMVKHGENQTNGPIPQALQDAMGEFVTQSFQSGILKDTAGLRPTSEGFRIRSRQKRLSVTDGPFTESKEAMSYGLWAMGYELWAMSCSLN